MTTRNDDELADEGHWLEVIAPTASARQVAHWGADSLLLGMRISLDGRQTFSAGRGARDELKCGLIGSENSVTQLKRNAKGGWVAHGKAGSTTFNGQNLGPSGRPLKDGDVVDGGAVAFRYHRGPRDALLGCAWRVHDVILFPAPFLGPRWFRALLLDDRSDGEGLRFAMGYVADPHHEEIKGKLVAAWRGTELYVLPDTHGPTLREIVARGRKAGGELDATAFAAICEDVKGTVESLDDVVVRFDGASVSCSLRTTMIGEPGARLRNILRAMNKQVGPERMDQARLGAVVRALFPEDAQQNAALVEEALLLDANSWRERVPAVDLSSIE